MKVQLSIVSIGRNQPHIIRTIGWWILPLQKDSGVSTPLFKVW